MKAPSLDRSAWIEIAHHGANAPADLQVEVADARC